MGAEECGHARVSLCFVLHYWISCQWNYNWCLWKVIVCCTLKVPIPFGCFTVLLSVFILLLERIRSVIFCYLLIWAHRNLLSHISELVWHHIVVHLYFNRAIYISIAFCYCQSVVRLTQLSETHYTHTRTHTNTHTHTHMDIPDVASKQVDMSWSDLAQWSRSLSPNTHAFTHTGLKQQHWVTTRRQPVTWLGPVPFYITQKP